MSPLQKTSRLILLRELPLFIEDHNKHMNTPCEQNGELLNLEATGTHVVDSKGFRRWYMTLRNTGFLDVSIVRNFE